MSSTADHIFPRQFFCIEDRANLPKVPSCQKCNSKKSKYELYLSSVLPFGGTHHNCKEELSVKVPKRLSKNHRLHRTIAKSRTDLYIIDEQSIYQKRLGIGFENQKLLSFISYVGKGLTWYHWNKYLKTQNAIRVFTPSESGTGLVHKLVSLNSPYKINSSLGKDTVRYRGILMEDEKDQLCIWGIQLFGGITVISQNPKRIFKNSFVSMVSGPSELIKDLNFLEESTITT